MKQTIGKMRHPCPARSGTVDCAEPTPDIPARETTDDRSATEQLALNWLEGHGRIMGFWLERLVAENGDVGLIDTLDRQSRWLRDMTDRLAPD